MNSLFLFDFTVRGVIKKFHSSFEFKVHSKKKVKNFNHLTIKYFQTNYYLKFLNYLVNI